MFHCAALYIVLLTINKFTIMFFFRIATVSDIQNVCVKNQINTDQINTDQSG